MKPLTWLLCVVLVAAMAASAPSPPSALAGAPAKNAPEAEKANPAAPAPAKTDAPAPPATAASPSADGDLALMIKECKLSDEQVAKLNTAATAAMAEIAQWQQANAEKLGSFQKAADVARQAQDEAAFRKVLSDAQPLVQERAALIMKSQKAILDVLTPDQKQVWMGFVAYRQLTAPLARANLTPEQEAKIRALCNGAAKEIGEIKAEGPEAIQAQGTILAKVVSTIRDQILTAEQRAILMPTAAGGSFPLPPTPTAPPAPIAPPAPKEK
jgi:Spy/CpxP family protein refolding chaperone